ncbi:hypothetical protein H4R18_001433, partial [Coemansia javaensis]
MSLLEPNPPSNDSGAMMPVRQIIREPCASTISFKIPDEIDFGEAKLKLRSIPEVKIGAIHTRYAARYIQFRYCNDEQAAAAIAASTNLTVGSHTIRPNYTIEWNKGLQTLQARSFRCGELDQKATGMASALGPYGEIKDIRWITDYDMITDFAVVIIDRTGNDAGTIPGII